MPSLRSLLGPPRWGAAAVTVLGLATGPVALAAATSGHCASRHEGQAGPASAAAHAGAGTTAMEAETRTGCPHCAATECAFLAPCGGGVTAVGAGAMPAIIGASPVRATAASAAPGPRSLALAPPTPPPLSIP